MTSVSPPARHGDGVIVACRRVDGRWLFIRRSAVVRAPLRDGVLKLYQHNRTMGQERDLSMPAKSRCQLTVRLYECDPLGHVNHAVYVHYFETGRIEAMAEAGLPFAEILKQGYTVVAADLFVQYKAPAFANDILDVQSYITSFRGARMTWQQELYRRSDGTLLAVAEVNGAFTRADGRPVRVPPSMRALLEVLYLPEAAWSLTRRL